MPKSKTLKKSLSTKKNVIKIENTGSYVLKPGDFYELVANDSENEIWITKIIVNQSGYKRIVDYVVPKNGGKLIINNNELVFEFDRKTISRLYMYEKGLLVWN